MGALSIACCLVPLTMTNALHAILSSSQHPQLNKLRHDPTLKPRARGRVEVLLFLTDRMTVPRLVTHFDCFQANVSLAASVRGGRPEVPTPPAAGTGP